MPKRVKASRNVRIKVFLAVHTYLLSRLQLARLKLPRFFPITEGAGRRDSYAADGRGQSEFTVHDGIRIVGQEDVSDGIIEGRAGERDRTDMDFCWMYAHGSVSRGNLNRSDDEMRTPKQPGQWGGRDPVQLAEIHFDSSRRGALRQLKL